VNKLRVVKPRNRGLIPGSSLFKGKGAHLIRGKAATETVFHNAYTTITLYSDNFCFLVTWHQCLNRWLVVL